MSAEQSSRNSEPGTIEPLPDQAETDPAPAAESEGHGPSKARLALGVLVLVTAVIGGLGLYWSVQPKPFSVESNLTERLGDDAVSGDDTPVSQVSGAAVVATQIRVARTLLHKPGGYLRNDMTPPGVLIDNMPNWEYGVVTELRDSVGSLRNEFSRSQSQSIESPRLQRADSDFNFSADAWFLPSSEEMFKDGVKNLEAYLDALVSGERNAGFYARADNLRGYLEVVEKRLGSYGQRLAASVGDPELTAALDSRRAAGEGEAPVVQQQRIDPTPWHQIDDVFYEARGYSWALLHMMNAIQIDFAKVLRDKNAEVSMKQIIADLEHAVVRKYSPIVLNGHGFGMLANHSLVLASYLGRANAAIIDLRVLLERG